MSGAAGRIAEIVGRGGEADDVLRAVVNELAELPGATWAGIAFLEDGEVVLGPSAGEPDPSRRAAIPVTYEGSTVGELQVDGQLSEDDLAQVVALVSPYVLIGWDTGGEAWEA